MKATRPQTTRSRLLDSAEAFFAERGYEGASLREITAAAEANLAAVNYHFGSKEELLVAVFLRRIGVVNGARLTALAELESGVERGEPPTLEQVIEVFVRPALELAADRDGGGAHFLRLMGRVHAETEGPWRRIVESGCFDEVQERFVGALGRALPELDEKDLIWRFHFAVGAMAHTILHAELVKHTSGGLCDPTDPDATLRQMVPFLARGFRSEQVPTKDR